MGFQSERRRFLTCMTSATCLGILHPTKALAESGSVPGSIASDVRVHGARGDGESLDTSFLQAAIDTCSKRGGGTVLFPPGRYLIGHALPQGQGVSSFDSGSHPFGEFPASGLPSDATGHSLLHG